MKTTTVLVAGATGLSGNETNMALRTTKVHVNIPRASSMGLGSCMSLIIESN